MEIEAIEKSSDHEEKNRILEDFNFLPKQEEKNRWRNTVMGSPFKPKQTHQINHNSERNIVSWSKQPKEKIKKNRKKGYSEEKNILNYLLEGGIEDPATARQKKTKSLINKKPKERRVNSFQDEEREQ